MTELFRLNNINLAVLDEERKRALNLIADAVAVEWIHEVGSTAVAGLLGKQDLDFLVLVPASKFEETRAALDSRFARNAEQMSNDVYQGYKIESEHDVAIQLTVENGPYDTFLVFLDQLRTRPGLRDEYNDLKKSFDGRSMAEYRKAKQEFVERVLASVPS